MQIHFSAFDSLPVGGRPSRHLYIDAEPELGGNFAVVVRGQDWAVVGRTARPESAQLVWNDATGEYVRFVVARGPASECRYAASKLREYFQSPEPQGVRLRRIGQALIPGTAALLSLLLTRFDCRSYVRGNGERSSLSGGVSERSCDTFYGPDNRISS